MDFGLTEEQELLRETAQRFVADVCPPERAKAWDESHHAPPELFTKEQLERWLGELEESRKLYMEAADAHRPVEANALVARYAYRGAVRAGLARLRDFKRDLQTMGLAEVGYRVPRASTAM